MSATIIIKYMYVTRNKSGKRYVKDTISHAPETLSRFAPIGFIFMGKNYFTLPFSSLSGVSLDAPYCLSNILTSI